MPWAIQVNGLPTIFQSVDAGIDNLIQVLVGSLCFGPDTHRIVGCDQRQGQHCLFMTQIFSLHPQAAGAVHFQAHVFPVLGEGILFHGSRLIQFPAKYLHIKPAGGFGFRRQITGINHIEIQQNPYFFTCGNPKIAALPGNLPLQGTDRNGCSLAVPDIHHRLCRHRLILG